MRRPILRLMLACLAPACGSTTTSASPVTPTIAAPTDTCPNAGGLVLEVPSAIPGHWSGATTTGGTVPVTLRWCGTGVIGVDSVVVRGAHSTSAEHNFDPAVTRLAHGESVSHDIPGPAEPQEVSVTATAHDASGHALHASAGTQAVLDPRFVSERDACAARGGAFAPAGMAGSYACDAATHDAGHRCLSSAECESACLETHAEVTTTPPDHRTCGPGEEVRLHVGTCSPHTLRFGCSPLLVDVTTECVRPGQTTGHRIVCVD